MKINCLFLIIFSTVLSTSAQTEAHSPEQRPLFLAHFMPWHVAPPIEPDWGWHWTMNHFDPEKTDENGHREIASHYYPLTGPYDSMDPDILEYEVLLMKLSGIDGVLVDWYGIGDLWDYPGINERTNALFEYIKKAELKFAIVYEDQTITHMINQNVVTEENKYAHAQEVMRYLKSTWFTQEEYVTIEGRPLLLTFGPQHFKKSSEWRDIFSILNTQPLFFTLDNRLAPAAVGAFSWPPMWKIQSDDILTEDLLKEYLEQFSLKSANWQVRLSSAFPAFHDIYKEAGVSEGYGFLDPENGSTFRMTLSHALSNDPAIIQLVTWNDYGEGTIIEPTEEFGYVYLDIIREVRSSVDSFFLPAQKHLRLPLQLFNMRKKYPADKDINETLEEVFELFIHMELDAAESLLKTITRIAETKSGQYPIEYRLHNFPNPFNSTTTILYHVPSPADINISVYNCAGQLVSELVQENKQAGKHTVTWDAGRLSSGVYFFRLGSITQKCLLLK